MAAQYGYIRVSSAEQNEARQVIAMREAGLDGNHIYMDKQSGKDFDRPQYQRLVRRLRPGDLLWVIGPQKMAAKLVSLGLLD